jgi:hypothetical protein
MSIILMISLCIWLVIFVVTALKSMSTPRQRAAHRQLAAERRWAREQRFG